MMRLSRNVGQEAAARFIGRSKTAIHRWETAKATPDLDELADLARHFAYRFVCHLAPAREADRIDRLSRMVASWPEAERDARTERVIAMADALYKPTASR